MHVVEGAAGFGQPLGQRRATLEAHLVPADMRDSQAGPAQRRHLSGDQAEPIRPLELLGTVEQQLHPQADPEQRRAAGDPLADRLDETELMQIAHRQRKRPDARQDEPVGSPQLVAVGRDRRPRARVLERLLDRAAIAHPVIDHADARPGAHTSVPFVLGTPVSLGSTATAARSARAVALNAASIT
jgi:hypothetical protein